MGASHTKVKDEFPKDAKHGRHASRQLEPESSKRGRVTTVTGNSNPNDSVRMRERPISRATEGLQRIFGPSAQFQSEGQAGAMELVHDPPKTSIIVLPTSSGKSALFFSVAAMAVRQTVIVVVPFSALVDDMVVRAQEHGLNCEEWRDVGSGHEERQLVVVSADRAVSPEFGHWAKGLELEGVLRHVFFDEGHVAFTDTSYRTRLRELWKLRYLRCPFTVLTATLMVELEEKLREQLLIPDAVLFRRSTVRPGIRYEVVDSKDRAPSDVGLEVVNKLGPLPAGKRGVVYVRSYRTGEFVREKLGCPFYKARADAKSEILAEWIRGRGGWIVATGALGTGVNIKGISHVVHIDRPYGLTSFVQQSGRGGRDGEISQSIVVVRVENTSGRRRSGIMSEYSTEQVDEDAMTEFIQSKGCRRQVLGRRMDGLGDGGIDCREGDWVPCDNCMIRSRGERRSGLEGTEMISRAGREESRGSRLGSEVDSGSGSGSEVEGSRLIEAESYNTAIAEEEMFQVMELFKRWCVYCQLIWGVKYRDGEEEHTYEECWEAEGQGIGSEAYEGWRKGVALGERDQCWGCGLSQQICRKVEGGGECEYPEIVFQGVFILEQKGFLERVVRMPSVGFRGSYEEDMWDWMGEVEAGQGRVWESNWMRTWRGVCQWYGKEMWDRT